LNSTAELYRIALFIFFGVLLLSLPQAALLPLIDRDEPRFAEASREMLESGNYIVPTFNHAPRYAKPPLIYWCQTVAYRLFGENAFAARLPSLLATAGTAVLLFFWGINLGGRFVGIIAAFSYAFCLQTVQQGRVATADALLIFFMTLTGWAGWKLVQIGQKPPTPETRQHWIFWGILLAIGFGGGFLAKGPEAWLPFLVLMIGGTFMSRRVQQAYLAIFALGLLLVACWAIPAFVMTHGDYWRQGLSEGVGERMVTGLQGHGASGPLSYILSLPYYLLLFWLSALPWSMLMLLNWKKLFVNVKSDPTDGYLYLNAAIIFIVFSLMVTKLPHYTLPAFPFIALLFARRWIAAGLKPIRPVVWTMGFGVGFALFAVVFIPAAMAQHASPSPVGELVRTTESEHALPPGTAFACVDFQEPNLVWETRRLTTGYVQTIPESDILDFLNQPGPRAVILSSQLFEKVRKDANEASATPHANWKIYQTTGFNAAKGKMIDLTMVIKP
jgi:4-amino-4-deoxy-L-arabinose transferase-like glycosyltransferase